MLKFALIVAVAAGAVAALSSALPLLGVSLPFGTPETERGFPIHSQASAPDETKPVLDWYAETFGFVPHLAGVMADSPALGLSYWQLQQNLQTKGSLTPPEDNIVQLAIAVENECQYCVAGHSFAAKSYFGSSEAEIEALRKAAKLPMPKLNALRTFALTVYESKGRISSEQLQAFLDAGYTRQQSLDVVANVAAKVMSNYTNQIAKTPLDEPLAGFAEGLPFSEKRTVISKN